MVGGVRGYVESDGEAEGLGLAGDAPDRTFGITFGELVAANALSGSSKPDQDAGYDDPGSVVAFVLVVAGGKTTPLLESVECRLSDVGFLVGLCIEVRRSPTSSSHGCLSGDPVTLLGDHSHDSSLPQDKPGRLPMGLSRGSGSCYRRIPRCRPQ